jgi:hypothetical protein
LLQHLDEVVTALGNGERPVDNRGNRAQRRQAEKEARRRSRRLARR